MLRGSLAFRFSLEAVLRLRRSQERVEWLRVLLLAGAIAQLNREIAVIDSQQREARQRIGSQMVAGIGATDLHWEATFERHRVERQAFLQKHVDDLRKRHSEQLRTFQKVRQRREILEKLRVRQLEIYAREGARREQLRLDESFLLYRHAQYRE